MLISKQEAQRGILILEDCKESDIACLLTSFYTEEILIPEHFPDIANNLFMVLMKLYVVATYFQVHRTLDLIEDHLESHPGTLVHDYCRVGRVILPKRIKARIIDAIQMYYDTCADREDMKSLFRRSLLETILGCLPILHSPMSLCLKYPEIFDGVDGVVARFCELRKLRTLRTLKDKCANERCSGAKTGEAGIIDAFRWIETSQPCVMCTDCFTLTRLDDWQLIAVEECSRPMVRVAHSHNVMKKLQSLRRAIQEQCVNLRSLVRKKEVNKESEPCPFTRRRCNCEDTMR